MFLKKNIIFLLKIIVPLVVGFYIVWYFYNALTKEEKEQVFEAFSKADYTWVLLSVFIGFLTFVIRAYRWRYLLKPMGYEVSFPPSFHSVMFGYLLNMIIPRAGEAGRAGALYKKTRVPVEKAFGTIVTERIVDMFFLGLITLITLGFQWNNLGVIQKRMALYLPEEEEKTSVLFYVILSVILFLICLVVYFLITRPAIRKKVKSFFSGFWEGMLSIRKSDNIARFIFFSALIWIFYVLMFWVCFFSFEETSGMSFGGVMAGFIAGTVGIIFVQGGIGIFPALVGIVITTYLYTDYSQPIHPVGFALGWIMWMSQTILIIILGLVSLVWLQNNKKYELPKEHGG